MFTLTTWSSLQPFCRDHEPVAWVKTILSLARYAMSYDDHHLAQITTWDCPSLDEWDIKSAKFGSIAELFVLLHEYGHILLGHLDSATVADKDGLKVFLTNHTQEFEADAFGNQRLEARLGDAAAMTVATLFRFLDLIEHLLHGASRGTNIHPPAKERWLRIKHSANLSDDGKGAVAVIESLFDMVISVAAHL